MGLDMYLYRLKNEVIEQEETVEEAFKVQYNAKSKEYGIDNYSADDWRKRYLSFRADTSFNVIYWRGMTSIHDFFVAHAQEGEDDCGYHVVDFELVEQLIADIDTRLMQLLGGAHPDVTVLPTRYRGFDVQTEEEATENDFKEFERTRDVLLELMNDIDEDTDTLVYHASW